MMIRPVRAFEAVALRSLRLEALRESPRAYFGSWEAEAALPLSDWVQWAVDPARVMFVAESGARWLGMAGAFSYPAGGGTVSLWWLWVAPEARGKGLAHRLFEKRAAWARERGATRLELAVAEDNVPALALYFGLGLRFTGERRTMASDPSRAELFLECSLDTAVWPEKAQAGMPISLTR
jgi:ribosomal protein S18 acetylase RimI-like enzyme